VGLGARLALLSAAPVMPPEDPAFYLGTALNLISGRGLTVDVVWTYRQGLPDLPRPGHEWWQPLLNTVNLLTGRPALSLPAPDPADAVLRIAHHYGARLVLISERAGRYPDELDGRPNQFRLVYRSERIAVYEIAD
jgi:hypothetical protein